MDVDGVNPVHTLWISMLASSLKINNLYPLSCRNPLSKWDHLGSSGIIWVMKNPYLQDGPPQICKSWFINHEITPSNYLVGGWATPLKDMKVNWDD